MSSPGSRTPVLAGLVVGVAFLILFAVFVPLIPQFPVSIPPAPLSIDDSAKSDFGSPKNINAGTSSYLADILLSGSIYLVSVGEQANLPDQEGVQIHDIFLTRSPDGGATLSETVNISNTKTDSGNPQLAVTDYNMYLAWQETVGSRNVEILFTKSDQGPSQFSDIINISNTPDESEHLDLAAIGDNVYAVWREFPSSNYLGSTEILFRVSNDRGETFQHPITLINGTGDFICPKLAVSTDGDVHVAWAADSYAEREMAIFFSSSSDGGSSFVNPIELRVKGESSQLHCPEIATYEDDVYVIWAEHARASGLTSLATVDKGDYSTNIYSRASHDRGKTFSPTMKLSKVGGDSIEPRIAVSYGGYVYVVWRSQMPNNDDSEVIFRRSTDGSRSFDPPINLSNSPVGSYLPELLTANNKVVVAWLEGDFQTDLNRVVLRQSTDFGSSFGEAVSLTGDTQVLSRPILASDYVRTYVGWSEFSEPNSSVTEAFFLTSIFSKSYLNIGTNGVGIIESGPLRRIASQVLADPQVSSLTVNAHSILLEDFQEYETPNILTIIVAQSLDVSGDWRSMYKISSSNRTEITIAIDEKGNVESTTFKQLPDRTTTLAFDKKRQAMIEIAAGDPEFQELARGKDAYFFAIRDYGVSMGEECPFGSCAIVSMRQVESDEFLSATLNPDTGKVIHIGQSKGW